MIRSLRVASVMLLICAFCSASALAQPRSESLMQPLPKGYMVDYEKSDIRLTTVIRVPENESRYSWTEMITTQIFENDRLQPDPFYRIMLKGWIDVCKNGSGAVIRKGSENGYPYIFFRLSCPLNPKTEQPEYTWFKAIRGRDRFYVVQKAFKWDPTKEQFARWTAYFRDVKICDPREPDKHPCPRLRKASKDDLDEAGR